MQQYNKRNKKDTRKQEANMILVNGGGSVDV